MRRRFIAVCLVLCLVTSVGSAATLTMTATPVGRFDDAFNPLPFNGTTDPGIYQVDFAFSISNLAANEKGWGALGFDVALSGVTDTIGWQGDTSLVDSNGLVPGGIVSKYATNLDAGPSATDLQRITVAIPSGLTAAIDPRTRIGNPGPDYIGSLFLKYAGVGSATMSVHNLGFLTTDLNGLLNTIEQPGTSPCGWCVTFPPDILPLDLGETELGIINVNLSATEGPAVWSSLTLVAGSPAFPATLSPTGQFQWNTVGSDRGQVGNGVHYSWSATATNSAGSDTDVAITLILIDADDNGGIPEPATAVLVGLAMIGLVGMIRRRG
jgi:hypothetical protein